MRDRLMRRGMTGALISSMLLAGCATDGQTVLGGTGSGAVAGSLLGAVLDGKRGAARGALIGAAVGTAAGAYVASRKARYANVEDRIAGEREITVAAIAAADKEVIACEARLVDLNQQLVALEYSTQERNKRRKRLAALLTDLGAQEKGLIAQRSQLEQTIKNQEAFVKETSGEVDRSDRGKAAQLEAWKSDIPKMRTALAALVDQSSEVGALKLRMQQIRNANA